MSPTVTFDPASVLDAYRASGGQTLAPIPGTHELLVLAYEASLLREEGRAVRGTYVLVPEELAVNMLLRFSPAPLLGTQWMRKLGVGFARDRTAVVVTWNEDSLWAHSVFALEENSFAPVVSQEQVCTVEVHDAAVLTYRRGVTEVHFIRGRCAQRTIQAGILDLLPGDLLDGVEGELVGEVLRTFPGEGPGDREATAREAVRSMPEVGARQVSEMLFKASANCVRDGVGIGLLLLSGQSSALDALDLASGVARLEECGQGAFPWSAPLRKSIAWEIAHSGERVPRPRPERIEKALALQAHRLADLARIDGAVIVTPLLAPLAVGAKLTVCREDISRLPEELGAILERRGTRHRSLAAIVAALPGSVGLVVSSDGEFFVISNCARRGLRWRAAQR